MYGYDLKLLIPAAHNRTYLNAATLGPTPGTVLAAATASELEWVEAGPGQDSHYVNAKSTARRFAERIQKRFTGGVVSLTENNSEGLLRVFWGLDFEPGQEIITTDQEHPAVLQALSSVARRFQLKVHVVRVDDEGGMVRQVKERISSKTRLVVMSHVSFLTGWRLPVERVAEVVRAQPMCRLLVDGAQALGNIDIEPEKTGADYYVFCGHKWMMAPAGWAGIWVRSARMEDLHTIWPRTEEAEHLIEGPFGAYPESGEGLEYGTRCWPRVAGWSITWDYFEEEGFAHQASYQRALADHAREALARFSDLTVQHPPASEYDETALVVVKSHVYGSGLYDMLLQHEIVTKAIPERQGIRIAWAIFNTEEDIQSLVGALGK